jgi:hypothetical protein
MYKYHKNLRVIDKIKFKNLKNPTFIGLGQEKNSPPLSSAQERTHLLWTRLYFEFYSPYIY